MKKFDAFISYSHKDCGSIAAAIQNGIQTIGRPWYQLKRNLNVFRDETNLNVTPELWTKITEALDNSQYFILFASPLAAQSKWVCDEISYWFSKKDDTGKPLSLDTIIIVQAQGDIEWDNINNDFDWFITTCLPQDIVSKKFVRTPYWIDLRSYVKESEKGKTIDHKSAGFTTAMTKIIGAITNVDPWKIESNELKAQRNSKRIRGLMASVFFALSIVIFLLYQNADKQKEIAIDSEKKAIENLKLFKLEEFNRNLRNGKIYIGAGEYRLAKEVLESARKTLLEPLCDTIAEIKKEKNTVSSLIHICEQNIQ